MPTALLCARAGEDEHGAVVSHEGDEAEQQQHYRHHHLHPLQQQEDQLEAAGSRSFHSPPQLEQEDLSLRFLGSLHSAASSAEHTAGPGAPAAAGTGPVHSRAQVAEERRRAERQVPAQQQRASAEALLELQAKPEAAGVPAEQHLQLQQQLSQLRQDYTTLAAHFQQYTAHTTSVITRMQLQVSALLASAAAPSSSAAAAGAADAAAPPVLPAQQQQQHSVAPQPAAGAAPAYPAYLSAPAIPSPYRASFPAPEPRASPSGPLLAPAAAAAAAQQRAQASVHEDQAVLPTLAALRRSLKHPLFANSARPAQAAAAAAGAADKENEGGQLLPRQLPAGILPAGVALSAQPISSNAPAAAMRYHTPAGQVPTKGRGGVQLPVMDAHSSLSLAAHLGAAGVRSAPQVRQFGI